MTPYSSLNVSVKPESTSLAMGHFAMRQHSRRLGVTPPVATTGPEDPSIDQPS